MAEVQLPGAAACVRLADAEVRSVDGALELREEPVDVVGRDFAACVPALVVVDGSVPVALAGAQLR